MKTFQERVRYLLQKFASGDKDALDRLACNFGRKLFKKSLDEENSKELAKFRYELGIFTTEDAYAAGYLKALSEVAYAYSSELGGELRQEAEVKHLRENNVLPLLAALKDGLKTLAQLVAELAPYEISEDRIKVFLNALVQTYMVDAWGGRTWEEASYTLAPYGRVILKRSQAENK